MFNFGTGGSATSPKKAANLPDVAQISSPTSGGAAGATATPFTFGKTAAPATVEVGGANAADKDKIGKVTVILLL